MILSIETSTPVCSVALHEISVNADSKLLGCFELFTAQSHSGELTLLIENLIKQTGYQFSDIKVVAISKGPGSYTGLRIGVSTAKGLAYAIGCELIAVSTLEAMALQIATMSLENDVLFCPMLDARRMEVYCSIFGKNTNVINNNASNNLLDDFLKEILPISAKIIDKDTFADILENNKIVFFGDGASKCKASFAHQKNALFIENITPSAKEIGFLANQKLNKQLFEDLNYFEPYYLKDFVTTVKKSNP